MLENLKLKINNYPARKVLNLYNLADRAQNIAEKGKQSAIEAAALYAASGDKLAEFKDYKISDISADLLYTEERELALVFKPGPEIDFKV